MAPRTKRLLHLAGLTGAVVGCGLVYALLCRMAGRPLIPCLFHNLTGLACPGCGMSRLCLALLRLDVSAAFRANQAVFLLLPFFALAALRLAFQYGNTGSCKPSPRLEKLLLTMAVVLLVYGFLRNLPGLEFLLPH